MEWRELLFYLDAKVVASFMPKLLFYTADLIDDSLPIFCPAAFQAVLPVLPASQLLFLLPLGKQRYSI